MDSPYMNGIVPDPRTEEQKALDHKHSDVAGDILIVWKEKPQSEWKKYIPREQNGSLSCCGQASAKAVEILNSTVMSAHPPYRSRSNYPDGGMFLQNVASVWKNIGSTTEALDVSQWQSESTMNRNITVETPTKIGGYAFPNPKSIDEIAQAIEVHKHCILIVHCNKSEWTATPVFNGSNIDFGHCVCAVDYFIKDGIKTLLIEDSTGHFNSLSPKDGQRLITEDFLIKRFEGALYFTLNVPSYIFMKLLKFGMKGVEVTELQKKLKTLGYFPSMQAVTDYFGPISLAAVKKFQLANKLVVDGIVGPASNKVLNSL